jgi:hypothetical protein
MLRKWDHLPWATDSQVEIPRLKHPTPWGSVHSSVLPSLSIFEWPPYKSFLWLVLSVLGAPGGYSQDRTQSIMTSDLGPNFLQLLPSPYRLLSSHPTDNPLLPLLGSLHLLGSWRLNIVLGPLSGLHFLFDNLIQSYNFGNYFLVGNSLALNPVGFFFFWHNFI